MADITSHHGVEPQTGAAHVPTQPLLRRARLWLIWAVVIAVLAWSWAPAEMWRVTALFTDFQNMATFSEGFANPSFRYWETYANEMVVTIQIAAWGTALAVLFGIPFAILASANICPQWIVQPVRRLMDISRATPEMVLALMFVVSVGLGPVAGVLALAVHNIGIIAKLFSEAVEAIDPRPVEGIRATGASRLQEIIFGVIPQVLPLWSSFTLYRFETNVRSATVLGVIGAGGIGQPLFETMRGFQYSEAATIVIIIVGAVMIIDVISAQLRKMLV
ncbi:MAG: phosphonate ABC transporter, permease protein PhnE [Hyphomicrobiales bacterium]|nr:phosphonate ABC transporter, permease protein PhnE [Hyphomicrobiales bacterium]